MSRDIFLKVRDAIAAEPDRYNQSQYRWNMQNCGTAFCIAGWLVECSEEYEHDMDSAYHAWDVLRGYRTHYLNAGTDISRLDGREAEVLFATAWEPKPELTLSQALTMLAEGYSVEDVTDRFRYECLLEDSSWEPGEDEDY
jgi:hypothetical protein